MTKRRKLLATIASGSLVTFAGCSDSAKQNSVTPTNQNSITTDKDSKFSHPAGLSSNGITDVTQLVEGHKEFLRKVPSYNEKWTLRNINSNGETGDNPTEMTVRADSTTGRLRLDYHDHVWDLSVFYDGTYYEYNERKNKVTEGSSPSGLFGDRLEYEPLALHYVTILMPSLLNIFTVTPDGTTDIEERTGIRYKVTGVSEKRKSKNDDVNYQGAEGRVVVTPKGGVLYLKYKPHFDSESTSLQTGSYKIKEIGNTTVSQPDWLAGK